MCLLDLWFSLSYFYSSGPDPACYLNERGEEGSEAGGVVVVGGGGAGVEDAGKSIGFG